MGTAGGPTLSRLCAPGLRFLCRLAIAAALCFLPPAQSDSLHAQSEKENYWDLSEPSHAPERQAPQPDDSRPATESEAPAGPEQKAEASPLAPAPAATTVTEARTQDQPGQAASLPPTQGPDGGADAPDSGSQAAVPGGESADALERRSLDALYRLGSEAQRRGVVIEAERYFMALLRRAPYHFLTHLALGKLYLSTDPRAAREHLAIARRVYPSSVDVHYALGQALEAVGRQLDAAESYRKAIYLNPRHYDANARLRGILRALREEKTVVERAAEAFYANPSLATLTLFGRIVMEHSQPRQAVLEFEDVLRRQPELAETNLWLARARHAANDTAGELAAYKRYLERFPEAAGVRLLVVERFAERGWYHNAGAMLKPFEAPAYQTRLAPESRARMNFLRSRLHSVRQQPGRAGELLLIAHEQQYDTSEIERAFAEDLALYAHVPALWFAYASWLRQIGRPSEAADALMRAGLLDATHRPKAKGILQRMLEERTAPVAARLALGELALAAGQISVALAHLGAVPPGHRLDHRASLLRGKIYRQQGNPQAALDAFTRYVFFFREPGDMIYARGNVFWELGKKEEALAVWIENPDVLIQRPALLINMADYYRGQGDVEREIAIRERLAQALPRHHRNRIVLGELYERQGRKSEAVFLWDRLLAERPRDPDLLVRVAKGWLALNEPARSLPLLQRASQLKPLDAEEAQLLARQLFADKQYEEALRVYWDLYQARPDHPDLPRVLPELALNVPAAPEVRRAAAEFALRSGRLQMAAEIMDALLHERPDDRTARMMLAELYLRMDKPVAAEQVLQEPGAGPEDTMGALTLLATVQQRLGRKPALSETLARLQRLRPDDGQLRRRRGLLLHTLRRYAEARPPLEQALARNGDDDEVVLALAGATQALGDDDRAEALFATLLERDPTHAVANRRMIALLLKQKRWDAAIPRLEAWVADHPRDGTARYNLVSAYLKRFNTDGARPHFEALREVNPRRARALAPYFR